MVTCFHAMLLTVRRITLGNAARRLFGIAIGSLMLSPAGFAQQTYVGRYDVFGGYAYLDSHHINLAENGFEFQTESGCGLGSPWGSITVFRRGARR